MAEEIKFRKDNFIDKIAPNSNEVPKTRLVKGFLGNSPLEKCIRLYFDAELRSYIEIPEKDILYAQELSASASPLGGSYLWIKRDAKLTYGGTNAEATKAKFLQGSIVKEYMSAAAAGSPWPPDGGIDNTVAFCPETFVDSPCDLTTVPIVCTINQLPTQQDWCFSNNCPPTWTCPPTWNCPPTNAHIICIPHTRICEVQYGGAGKQPGQPGGGGQTGQPLTVPRVICPQHLTHVSPLCGHTIADKCPAPVPYGYSIKGPICPTLIPGCNFTVSKEICPTHTPACFPSVNEICATHTPVCFPSVREICATHTPACQPTVEICYTRIPVCQPVTLPQCYGVSVIGCPSFGPCPSVACGFGTGNPAAY